MSINNASINDGATAVSPTGGTAKTLNTMGVQADQNVAYFAADTSMKTRRTAEFSKKASKANASSIGGFTQARNKVKLTFPRVKADGSLTADTLTMELARDIDATDAEVVNYLLIGAQVLGDTDFLDFWKIQSLQ